MNRDYTHPHPDAIFKDKPTGFIEVYCNIPKKPFPRFTYYSDIDSIRNLPYTIVSTEHFTTIHTLALFVIKPKQQTP